LSKRPAGALAGIAMILLLAAPAGAETRLSAPAVRDVVLVRPGAASARISATASTQRYPVNDGSDATIAVAVTAGCEATCEAAEPQAIANFVGTLIHSFEIDLLTVQLDTPFQLGIDCGFEAEACYYSGQNKMVISGDAWTGIAGATREFIVAHEYGHHVAQHRDNVAPFPTAIDWGPPRWASYEHVCQGWRAGTLFPEGEGTHYYAHPGEAFAEAFAHNRFPEARVRWRWTPSLKPTPAAFRAIREDTLSPWLGRGSFTLNGRFPARGATVEWLRTPLDGRLSLRPSGLRRHGYRLILRGPGGQVLRTSRQGLGPHHQLNYTVCGQSRLGIVIKPTRHSGGAFKLQVQRP
jgi:hypothetical protein